MVERIKELCKKRGTNLFRLESELGLANGTIKRWDKNTPSADRLMLVASYFGVSVEYLLTGEDKRQALFENMLIHSEQKQPAVIGELSEDEIKLLAAYRKILDQKKPGYLDMLERAAEHKE